MKYRFGFVSNSSSSSFTCDVCRETFSGWGAEPQGFDHQGCENGHTFCEDQMINRDRFERLVELGEEMGSEDILDNIPYKDYYKPEVYEKYGIADDQQYECPAEFCPVCQMVHVDANDIMRYLHKLLNMDRDTVIAAIKDRFKTYEALQEFLKE